MTNQQKSPLQNYPSPPSDAESLTSNLSQPALTPWSSERWLVNGRVVWWVVALVVVFLTAASLLSGFTRYQSVCPYAVCDSQLNAVQAGQLQNLGLSVTFYAYFYTGILTIVSAIYILVAFLLFRRRSTGWIGLLGAYTLIVFGTMTAFQTSQIISLAYPVLGILVNILDYLGIVLLPLFIIVFPDGRLKPRWTIGLVAAWAILRFPVYFLPLSPLDLNTWPLWMIILIWAVFIGSLLLVQFYRYRRLYGPVLRQQAKWVVYGLMVALVGYDAVWVSSALLPAPVRDSALVVLFKAVIADLLLVIIPVSIAIAILRYRLWDIDLIINRTLVYILLTAIVGGLYSASITLFQKVFVATTGAKSDTALVLTTFLLVTTFTPIKNGLQTAVDKRFKESANPLEEIHILNHQVRSIVEVLDARLVTHRLLDTALRALQASGGAVYLEQAGQKVLAHATPGWKEADSRLSLPLQWNGTRLGLLCLGARQSGIEYDAQERQALQQAVDLVARAMAGMTMDRYDIGS